MPTEQKSENTIFGVAHYAEVHALRNTVLLSGMETVGESLDGGHPGIIARFVEMERKAIRARIINARPGCRPLTKCGEALKSAQAGTGRKLDASGEQGGPDQRRRQGHGLG